MMQIELGNIVADVELKDIKNIHLSVYPPAGRVRISAPKRMKVETIRIYAISKLGWIKRQQTKIQGQQREPVRSFLNRESHYYLGNRYLLKVVYKEAKPSVKIEHDKLIVQVRPGATSEQRQIVLDEWYRDQIKSTALKLISKWEKIMQLRVKDLGIKKMKTKWGTCNAEAGRIWLNLELAKKPIQCIEYIVVHEMVHLIERSHNDRFVALMDKYQPQWRHLKDELNRLPVSHVEWKY